MSEKTELPAGVPEETQEGQQSPATTPSGIAHDDGTSPESAAVTDTLSFPLAELVEEKEEDDDGDDLPPSGQELAPVAELLAEDDSPPELEEQAQEESQDDVAPQQEGKPGWGSSSDGSSDSGEIDTEAELELFDEMVMTHGREEGQNRFNAILAVESRERAFAHRANSAPIRSLQLTTHKECAFWKETSGGDSLLRHLENVIATVAYPVVKTGILPAASRLPCDAPFFRTLSVQGGIVPTFVAWDEKPVYFLPKKMVRCTSNVGGVYTRGTKYHKREGYNAFFSMDRRVVLVKTNSRTTQFLEPGECPLIPEGAVLSPCDLSLDELQNESHFQELPQALPECELMERLVRQFPADHGFRWTNYFEVVPRGWMSSPEVTELIETQFSMALPQDFFPEKDQAQIMREAIGQLVDKNLVEEEYFKNLSNEDLRSLYKELAENHPTLLSCSEESLGSGFRLLKEPEPQLQGPILTHAQKCLRWTRESVSKTSLQFEKDTETLRYSVNLEVQEVIGGVVGAPIPLEWGSLLHERSPAALARGMAVLTTASKIGQSVFFVRGRAVGSVGVRLKSAQPHVSSQNTSIKGGRAIDDVALWMETRESLIEGEMWIPVLCYKPLSPPSPSLHTLTRDMQDLIFCSIMTADLDPSMFGASSGPILAPAHPVGVLDAQIGIHFERSSFLVPYRDHEGALHYLNANKGYLDDPMNPLHGLPEYLDRFLIRQGMEPNGGGIKIVIPLESNWERPLLPLIRIFDEKTGEWRDFPMVWKANSEPLTADTAILKYEQLAAVGEASALVKQYTQAGKANAQPKPPPDSTDKVEGKSGAQAVASARKSDASARATPHPPPSGTNVPNAKKKKRALKVPPAKTSGAGVTFLQGTATKVATAKAADGTIKPDLDHQLLWAGAFANCPVKKRKAWKHDLRLLTWLSRQHNPNALVKVNVRKSWIRPLRVIQDDLALPDPGYRKFTHTCYGEDYDRTFQW